MADIAPSGVSGTGHIVRKQAGAAISEGDWVYVDNSDGGRVKPASNAASATAQVYGVALNDAADDSLVMVLVDAGNSLYDPGVALTEGVMYVLSTGGAMAPVEDHTGASGSGKYPTYLGLGTSTGKLKLNIDIPTAALA